MSLKHLGQGSQFPPLTPGKLRIYSMVFCPYAQRPRLICAAKNIPFETVNVKLNKKPEWYLELNPLGQVPCLQHDDGRTLPESLIVSEYLDQIYPENRLIPTDPYTNASHRLTIETFNKVIMNFYKLLRGGGEEAAKDFLNSLDLFEKKLTHDYYGGEKPAFVDYMIWPWFDRLEYLIFAKKIELNPERFPRLLSYIQRMQQLPAVKATRIPVEAHEKFYKGYLAGEEPDYDVGLPN